MKNSIDEEVAFQTAKLQVCNASINRTPCTTSVHVFLEGWRWDIETAVIISYLHLTHPKFDWKVIFPINAFPVSTDYIICFSNATMTPITNWCTYTCWGYESTRLLVKIGSPIKKHFLFPAFHKLARIQHSLLCIYTQVVQRTNHVSPYLQLTSHKLCKLEVRYAWVESFSCWNKFTLIVSVFCIRLLL